MPYFFKDGKKTIDFVIIYNVFVTRKPLILTKMEYFISNLEQQGFKLEIDKYEANENITFVKIYAPNRVLRHFAQVFSIELECETTDFRPVPKKPPFKFMSSVLIDPDINLNEDYRRAPESISGTRPKDPTSAEKALVIFNVLNQTSFGEGKSDVGIGKLIRAGVFEDAFPVHDGTYKWSDTGPLNDRQLLNKYWSSCYSFWKYQPLNLIEKYYGPQVALYFAWLGFYNKMLMPAALIGVVCFVLGFLSFHESYNNRTKEVCESDKMLCPDCFVKGCTYEKLSNSCVHSRLAYFFDNPFTVTFAAMMSVWSTIFMELWHRHELILQIRWNLRAVEIDTSLRPEFEENTKYRRISPVTGILEPYIPNQILCCKYSFTWITIFFLVFLVLLGIFGVLMYSATITVVLKKHSGDHFVVQNGKMIASFTASLISLVFILIFEQIYDRIARCLTSLENPRTEIDFNNSYAYKSYALACVNYYSATVYIAFFKGRFYTHPGDKKLRSGLGILQSDLCEPSGCIINLGMQMFVIMIAKSFISNFQQFILPFFKIFLAKIMNKKVKKRESKSWKEDYDLNPIQHNHFVKEYIQMTIQYGFVVFFAAAFPLAPLLALINNLVELRVDAYKLTRTFRRPIPFKTANIGAWNGILQGITYVGVVTNAFVIAFTSEIVQREMYRVQTNTSSLAGYVATTLSSFDVDEFDIDFGTIDGDICYYPGYRNPPNSTEKYQLSRSYWHQLAIKFTTVVVFEHVLMFVAGMIAYAIPDIPFSVKERMNYETRMSKENKTKKLSEDYVKTTSGGPVGGPKKNK